MRAEKQRGLTLVEMLVALAILGVVATVAVPFAAGGREDRELRAAARDVAAELGRTRMAAILQNRTQRFAAEVVSGSYRARDAPVARTVPAGVRLSLLTTAEDREGETAGMIRFFPDGSSGGGGVVLENGNRRYDVVVDWLTGKVSIGETGVSRPSR